MVFRLSEIEMIFLKWWKNTTYQRSYMLFHQQPERIEKKYLIYARIQTVMFLLYPESIRWLTEGYQSQALGL